MKKIFLMAAMVQVFTACVSNDDLAPVDNYGYVNVRVNNDPTVETKAQQEVGFGTGTWKITYQGTKGGEQEIQAASTKLPADTYTFRAKSNESEETAYTTNEGWGEAFYSGELTNQVLGAGETKEVNIDCGKAKNARMKVTFNFGSAAEKFTEYNLVADASDRNLTFDAAAQDKAAYFAATAQVGYTLTYTYNNGEPKTVTGTITMKGAATENVINITANTNGTITIKITYDDEFTQGTSQDITIDAATGEEVKAEA